MITSIKPIAEQQPKPIECTAEAITQILDYAATHPNDDVRYKASDMVLHVHSDYS